MCCDLLIYWLALRHVCQLIQFKKWTFFVFLCNYKNTSGSLGERTMGIISTAFIDCCILTWP